MLFASVWQHGAGAMGCVPSTHGGTGTLPPPSRRPLAKPRPEASTPQATSAPHTPSAQQVFSTTHTETRRPIQLAASPPVDRVVLDIKCDPSDSPDVAAAAAGIVRVGATSAALQSQFQPQTLSQAHAGHQQPVLSLSGATVADSSSDLREVVVCSDLLDSQPQKDRIRLGRQRTVRTRVSPGYLKKARLASTTTSLQNTAGEAGVVPILYSSEDDMSILQSQQPQTERTERSTPTLATEIPTSPACGRLVVTQPTASLPAPVPNAASRPPVVTTRKPHTQHPAAAAFQGDDDSPFTAYERRLLVYARTMEAASNCGGDWSQGTGGSKAGA